MITSVENRAWPGDLAFGAGYREAGLPSPSLIRTSKIATIGAHHAEPIGKVSPAMLALVDQPILKTLGA
jgi:hypothetical protein